MKTRRDNAGFGLLALLVALSLTALLAAALLPAGAPVLRGEARRETLLEMEMLATAVEELYRDSGELSADPDDVLDPSGPGWSGPYVRGAVRDRWSGAAGILVDGFGNAYRFTPSATSVTIASDGPDRQSGTGDDLEFVVDVEPLMRERTLLELRILNIAVDHYNVEHLAEDPLPASWQLALSMLESAGYLPPGAGYETDGWGSVYVGDPVGVSPLTEVASSNLTEGEDA